MSETSIQTKTRTNAAACSFMHSTLTVVRVHDGMNETIQENRQKNVSVVINMRVEPVKEKDGRVMVNMQKGKLTPLFAKNDKNGVPKVPNLGNVKQPEQIGRGWVRGIVGIARSESVPVTVGNHPCFNRHVGAQHDL